MNICRGGKAELAVSLSSHWQLLCVFHRDNWCLIASKLLLSFGLRAFICAVRSPTAFALLGEVKLVVVVACTLLLLCLVYTSASKRRFAAFCCGAAACVDLGDMGNGRARLILTTPYRMWPIALKRRGGYKGDSRQIRIFCKGAWLTEHSTLVCVQIY